MTQWQIFTEFLRNSRKFNIATCSKCLQLEILPLRISQDRYISFKIHKGSVNQPYIRI